MKYPLDQGVNAAVEKVKDFMTRHNEVYGRLKKKDFMTRHKKVFARLEKKEEKKVVVVE